MDLTRRSKMLIMVSADLICLSASLWSAFALRFSNWWPEDWLSSASLLFMFAPLVGVFAFAHLGLYRVVIRFVSLRLTALVASGVSVLVILSYLLIFISGINVPRSIPIIFGLSAWVSVVGVRLLVRSYYYWLNSKVSVGRAIIYGAGAAGSQLLASLSRGHVMKVVGFIDEDPKLSGTTIAGVMVHHVANLAETIEKRHVDTVLIALPNVSRSKRRDVLKKLIKYPVHVLTIPSISEILSGASVDNVRELDVEDLLGRDVVEPLPHLMAKSLEGKSVCITGAGGSIGSELARLCIQQSIKKLVLVESSEFALYKIERELNNINSGSLEIVALLGSVTDAQFMLHTLSHYQVQTVYHAAAYKHVPMVEQNPFAGVCNNVLGTKVTADAAAKVGVERFILISTDKAVRPTNIMGATKRVSELTLWTLANQPRIKTIFTMVRFGNVLDSSGSVVPVFRQQIKCGGPVQVTHKDINRFFMTISEAASLVIQAGSMANGGEVFLLHMGEPVRIVDLAISMIKLSGYTIKDQEHPDGDIEIIYTGLRPGEKLYEELLVDDKALETGHNKIFCAREAGIAPQLLEDFFHRIQQVISSYDERQLKHMLGVIVEGYKPADLVQSFPSSNVVELSRN